MSYTISTILTFLKYIIIIPHTNAIVVTSPRIGKRKTVLLLVFGYKKLNSAPVSV